MLAGALVALSVPPWGFWPLAFVGVALLAWRLTDLNGWRTRAFAGLLFGFGLFGPSLFWISEFHAVGYVFLLLLEGSFFAGACAIVPAQRRATLLALPGSFVIAEVARGVVPFGGLPMGGIPLGQAAGPLVPAARIGGAYLVTGIAVAVGCAIAAVARREHRDLRLAGSLAAVAVSCVGLGLIAPDGGPGVGTLRVAIVQGGGPRGFRAVESDSGEVLQAHLDVSRNLQPPLDLVLWPENTVDVPGIDGSAEEAALAAVARRINATLVAGVTEDAALDNFQNVAVAWAPDGRIVDRYIKAHRVPFGEYVPLRGFLERVVDLSVLPRDAVAGKGPGVLHTPAGDLGVAISYEVFFGERGRAAANAGGRILLVPTNAASFTSSQVPTQEIASAQLQAWQTGRCVLQSAPTGYSAIIDHRGRVLARSTLSRPEILAGRADLRSGKTIYVRTGDLPLLLIAVVLLAYTRIPLSRRDWLARPGRASERSASASAPASGDPRQ